MGFKIAEHLNGTAAAKPFSYDVLMRILFSSISIQYVLYFMSRIYEVGLRHNNKIGWKCEAFLKQLRLLNWLRRLKCALVWNGPHC